ncbi:hypothetical protein J3R30DRAFT_2171475 [Lentinula aciculospora]|uniref:T6SS Phospholipase effector Tle1-like catalytic domain-containing protein n=1 Tax=Lentinula aciculospora TaxID=153920 RepID=A0A9W9AI46_9AGAR|nr:hypothetical protein J3R30DRAFT_2171475 [Lentinula aciculospora]
MFDDTNPSNVRTHILCFDGTANEYDSENTNVVKFFAILKKDNCDDQRCYYQAGIGTFFAPGVVSPLFQWCAKVLDEAFAWYLNAHVMDGYKFLMQNYRAGDKICLFGFSRGAYTARALAGMLYKIGLLPRDNQEQIPFAYKLYSRTDDAGIQLSAGFKKTYCRPVEIEFLGVWDTVASVGVIATKTLPFTSDNSSIKTFRQALSLDEHRARFKPNLFHRELPNASGSAEVEGRRVETVPKPTADLESHSMSKTLSDYFHKKKPTTKLEIPNNAFKMEEQTTTRETDVLEVWFAGCHSDIGGGSVSNSTKQCLSDITLRWMVRQVMESQCGIQFNEDGLTQLNICFETMPVPSTSDSASVNSGNSHASWKVLDILDSVQPLHDQLVLNRAWWLLEVLPIKSRYQDADCQWHTSYAWNLGRGRQIHTPKPYFHMTVKHRCEDKTLAYKPKARWPEGTEVYLE